MAILGSPFDDIYIRLLPHIFGKGIREPYYRLVLCLPLTVIEYHKLRHR